jgi:hypothetical protein
MGLKSHYTAVNYTAGVLLCLIHSVTSLWSSKLASPEKEYLYKSHTKTTNEMNAARKVKQCRWKKKSVTERHELSNSGTPITVLEVETQREYEIQWNAKWKIKGHQELLLNRSFQSRRQVSCFCVSCISQQEIGQLFSVPCHTWIIVITSILFLRWYQWLVGLIVIPSTINNPITNIYFIHSNRGPLPDSRPERKCFWIYELFGKTISFDNSSLKQVSTKRHYTYGYKVNYICSTISRITNAWKNIHATQNNHPCLPSQSPFHLYFAYLDPDLSTVPTSSFIPTLLIASVTAQSLSLPLTLKSSIDCH